MKLTDAERRRFELKVDRTGGPDACHPWTAGLQSQGYGSFWLRGANVLAHRLALALRVGTVPARKIACHACDNRPCCNERHLSVGSHSKNLCDAWLRGRRRPRELTVEAADDVQEERRA